jgi:pyruvate,orthophosphate dikinase
MTKWVYSFGPNGSDGREDMRQLLGGKGANLAEMASLHLPVPPGFTITTEVCAYQIKHGQYPEDLDRQVKDALKSVEQEVGHSFGDPKNPLLVSVRSGAPVSMPGMMDTVLNLGLNDETVAGLARKSGDERFAFDSYRRFIQMFGDVVLGVDHHRFEDALEQYKDGKNVTLDTELSAHDWRELIEEYKAIVKEDVGRPFPQDVHAQLWDAVGAVFGSWSNQRARTYRRLHNIPEEWGTAVNVQAMVFGNMGDDCATGVAFTRDPSTGENDFYGEFLPNAQGEDVVAGIRTPQPLTEHSRHKNETDLPSMEQTMPEVYRQLCDVRAKLESHYLDMQDIEFTVQRGTLYMLQTRTGKRTAKAALKIAVDMVRDGLIGQERAVERVTPGSLDQLLHPTLDPDAEKDVISRGLPASPGAASGTIVFTADEAEQRAEAGEKVILCRVETSPEDIHGMHAAEGILTTRGGMTSHAAVVARGMGRPCVAGAGDLRIDYKSGTMRVRDVELGAGDTITIDGGSGEIIRGEVPTVEPKLSGDFATLMGWADEIRRLKVRTNAETPNDARAAVKFGAEGIGLCRTEHMFFESDRIVAVREMILADSADGRRTPLARILPMQRDDFAQLFRIMRGLPVTIRLLDPPLHEFLPREDGEMREMAEATGLSEREVRARASRLRETNPMLGHRGCRLGVTYPEIYEMQVRAIFEAACRVAQEEGETVEPEIMIPLVAIDRELQQLRELTDRVAGEVMDKHGRKVNYLVGTMIELPRACMTADHIARYADFFSFGTNDLTQTAYGISRDDSAAFLPSYEHQGIIDRDPFITMDPDGVGALVDLAAERGRRTRPDIKLGICGEHGGDPDSIRQCQEIGLDYVSCSPFRVPIARLAAAQAALKAGKAKREGQKQAAQ